MTPKEAIDILDQVVATVNANRETHERIQLAVSIVKNFIKANTEVETPPEHLLEIDKPLKS